MVSDYATLLSNIIDYIEREVLYNNINKSLREISLPFYPEFSTNHRVKEDNNIKRIIEHYYGPKIRVGIERGKNRTIFILRIVEEENKK